MSPKVSINQNDGWIRKARCSKKLEEETNHCVSISGKTYPEYIKAAVEAYNEKTLHNDCLKPILRKLFSGEVLTEEEEIIFKEYLEG